MLYFGSALRMLLAGLTLFVYWCSDALRIVFGAQSSVWAQSVDEHEINYNDARVSLLFPTILNFIEASLLPIGMLACGIASIIAATYGYTKKSKVAKWAAAAFLVTALLMFLLHFTMGVFFNFEMINTGM